MEKEFLIKEQHNKIILFFGGWGTAPTYFRHLKSADADVCLFYNYNSGIDSSTVEEVCSQYRSVSVIAWSFGVWVANHVLQKVAINKAVAVNGTLQPVNDDFGIPERIFKGTLDGLTEASLKKFNLRMCGNRANFVEFSAIKPQRTFTDVSDELRILGEYFEESKDSHNIYHEAVICENDTIFPLANQKKYWKTRVEIRLLQLAHFPFFDFDSWQQVLEV